MIVLISFYFCHALPGLKFPTDLKYIFFNIISGNLFFCQIILNSLGKLICSA